MKLEEFKSAAQNILANVQVSQTTTEGLVNMSRILTSVGMMVDLGVSESQLVALSDIVNFFKREALPQILSKATNPATGLVNRGYLLTSAYETIMSLGIPLVTMYYDSIFEVFYELSGACEEMCGRSIAAPVFDTDFMKLRLSSMSHWCFEKWTTNDETGNEMPLSLSQGAVLAFSESWAKDLKADGTWFGVVRKQALRRVCLMREAELKSGNESWRDAQEKAFAHYGNFAEVPADGFHAVDLDAIEALLEAMNSNILCDEDQDRIIVLRKVLSVALAKHMDILGINPSSPQNYNGYELKAIALAAANDSQLIIAKIMGYAD